MPERVERIRAELDERVARVRGRLAALSDDELGRARGLEGWTAGLVLLHLALALRRQGGWLERALAGRSPARFSWERTHRLNALVAREHGQPSRRQIDACIALGYERFRGVIARLGEADLHREALVVGDRRVSIAVVLSRIVIRHLDDHLASLDAVGEIGPSVSVRS